MAVRQLRWLLRRLRGLRWRHLGLGLRRLGQQLGGPGLAVLEHGCQGKSTRLLLRLAVAIAPRISAALVRYSPESQRRCRKRPSRRVDAVGQLAVALRLLPVAVSEVVTSPQASTGTTSSMRRISRSKEGQHRGGCLHPRGTGRAHSCFRSGLRSPLHRLWQGARNCSASCFTFLPRR